ncbi:DNA modification methylase [Desulfonema ishimotonii]|uniref:site-specific DNA-methyltransferase (cytosine-N(4)-specific) n=1 Tax=Desulfonema ishimotonii TaxID=45657 RepID=A0A401FUT1_9BACT|nr:DNA methyltransferase [Desulfonema ishimotonii]GBC60732.1 DNA modification methylase [Desulfonema ishimotonii]
MKLPVHRWFRYSAGFSAEWVTHLIKAQRGSEHLRILDPFAGSGTTLLAAESCGVRCIGFEPHPFVYRIARAKLSWQSDTAQLREKYQQVLRIAAQRQPETDRSDSPLLQKCYTPENLAKLDALRRTYTELSASHDDGGMWELIWLGITGILRICSTAGTAQWQYVLPRKKKARVSDAFCAFEQKMEEIISDIRRVKSLNWKQTASVFSTDARNPEIESDAKFDWVITSPPYPNNYDYADATRLEMTFWGEITGWKDLQSVVRKYLLHSCSQHAAAEKLRLDDLLQNRLLKPICGQLSQACNELAEIRLTKGGKKTYHTMAAAYFLDLAKVFHALRPLCRENAHLCFVIGDSAPYGVYLAVDEWLGQLAVSAGFKGYSFEKIRDRNTKWKNRKHTVPLHEGRLWIEG